MKIPTDKTKHFFRDRLIESYLESVIWGIEHDFCRNSKRSIGFKNRVNFIIPSGKLEIMHRMQAKSHIFYIKLNGKTISYQGLALMPKEIQQILGLNEKQVTEQVTL